MAIKNFQDAAAYAAAAKPTIESQVSMIEANKEVKYDGVNVITTEPSVGDLLMLDENNNRVYLKGGSWIQKANIPAAWTHVGYVFMSKGRKVGIINKTGYDMKYLGVSQFAWTDAVLDGEEHEKTIGLRFGIPNWDTTTSITFTYTATTLAEAAAAVQEAIEDKLEELEASAAVIGEWWAYADADNESVIVQRDNCTDYRFYNCTGLTHITWEDMPASTVYFKVNDKSTNYYGLMNIARGKAYYQTNGRTPDAIIHVGGEGNVTPVSLSAFNTSAYCAEIRAYYGTYENYLKGEFQVRYPQKYGTFALGGGKALAEKYANKTAPTKSGGTMYKYPAFGKCYDTEYNADGLRKGDFWLPGSLEGCYLLDDEALALVAASVTKMGTTAINNSTNRWFAERCSVYDARIFSGNNGSLYTSNVHYALRAQAVTLLDV